MAEFHYEKFKGPFGTPALILAVEAWQYLLRNELVDIHANPVSWDDEVLLAMRGSQAVGIITFANQEWNKAIILRMGYVRPAFWGQGIYRHLWGMLVKEAQARNVPRISSATYLKNERVRELSRRRGSVEKMVTLEFEVPKAPAKKVKRG